MKHFNLLKRLILPMLAACVSLQAYAAPVTYTVGTPSGFFADMATAITWLNNANLTQPVVLNVLPGSYSGNNWTGVINSVNGASATNTITIQALNGPGTVTITNAGTSGIPYLIKLNNASFIAIKNLTFVNSATAGYGTNIMFSGTSANDSVISCTMSTGVTTATGADNAVVQLGNSSTAFGGGTIVIKGNTITNGSYGVYINGSSTPTVDNVIVDNNTMTDQNNTVIYNNYCGNFKARSNNITSTKNMSYVIYNNNNVNGMDVSSNTANINAVSPTIIGIYNNQVNAGGTSTLPHYLNDNTINLVVTTGNATTLYNNSCYNLSMTGNKFLAQATSSGTVNPPTVLNVCYNSTLRYNVFKDYTTSGAIGANTYNFAYNCTNSTFSYNTIIDSTTSGSLYSAASINWAYAANGFYCDHNMIRRVSSASGAYGSTNSATYGYYNAQNCTFNADTVIIATANTGTAYNGVFLGYYNCYNGTNMQIDSNVITLNSLGATNIYSLFGYAYSFYSGTNISVSRNYFNFNITTSLGTCYGLGYYLGYSVTNFRFNNNTTAINGGTGGTLYACGMYAIYSANGCSYRNNVWNTNGTTGLSLYTFYYYMGYSGSADTIENNTLNMTTTTGSIYHYNYYAGNGALIRNNNFNYNTTTGTIYTSGSYYPYGAVFLRNNWKATTTTGTIYGLYDYGGGSTTYSGNFYIANNWDLRSTSGTVYGYYGAYYNNGTTLIGNVMSTKTTGTSYLFNNTYGYTGDVKFFNNTFHSNSTGATNVLLLQSGSSTSYPGKCNMFNNIFSRSNATTSGNDIAIGDTTYFVSDYNLVYSPGTWFQMNSTNPAVTTSSLAAWRAGTGRDNNTLFGNPGYTDAANANFIPNAADPNSWNASGRGIHKAGDTIDASGASRPKVVTQGPPDLGAYEFTPTSTPNDATAIPANPVANGTQVFLVGGDSAFVIKWGAVVPASISLKQYTGVQPGPMPYAGVGRMYNYVAVSAPLGVYDYKPFFLYKDPQLGDITTESKARLARSANSGTWMAYNYTNGVTDSLRNALTAAANLDSLPAQFSGVQNARIGIRCVVSPSGLAHGGITASSATETWDAEFSPVGYQVAFDSVKMPNPALSNTLRFTNTNSITLGAYPLDPSNRLQEFTKYYVYVRTICGATDTSGWSIDSFVTIISCHTPQPKVASVTGTQAVIYWDSVRTIGSYEVILNQDPSDPAVGVPWTSATYLSQSLQPGNTYYFHIRAHCTTIYTNSDWGSVSFSTWGLNVGDVNGKGSGIVSYPNPVSDVLTILSTSKPAGIAHITVTDINGKLVKVAEMTNEKLELNMSGLSSGIYNVKYTDNNSTEVMKVTKQ